MKGGYPHLTGFEINFKTVNIYMNNTHTRVVSSHYRLSIIFTGHIHVDRFQIRQLSYFCQRAINACDAA